MAYLQNLENQKWLGSFIFIKMSDKPRIVVHMFPRHRTRPSGSPFIIKLETYLRMAGISYDVDFAKPMGPKGKSPWITFDGQEVSKFCFRALYFELVFSEILDRKNFFLPFCSVFLHFLLIFFLVLFLKNNFNY